MTNIRFALVNYRAVKDATLSLAPIALVAGRNGRGKTSIFESFRAVLLREAWHLPKLTKASARALVYRPAWLRTLDRKLAAGEITQAQFDEALATPPGALPAYALAAIEHEGTDAGPASIVWPDCKLSDKDSAPKASPFAAGALQLLKLDPKERTKALARYIPVLPDKAALAEKMDAAKFQPDAVTAYWDKIAKEGWDSVHGIVEKHVAKLIVEWEAITGENYGSNKGADWKHATYPGMGLSQVDLFQELGDAEKALEAALIAQGRTAAEVEALQKDIAHGDAVDIGAAEAIEKGAEGMVTYAQSELAKIPGMPTESTKLSCPECGCEVQLQVTGKPTTPPSAHKHLEYALLKPGAPAELTVKDSAEARERRMVAEGKVTKAITTKTEASQNLAKLREIVEKGAKAKTELHGDGAAAAAPRATEASLQAVTLARAARDQAKASYDGHMITARAAEKHTLIAKQQLLKAILAPDGLRKEKLGAALNAFNFELAALSKLAGWDQPVRLDANLDGWYGGEAYEWLSRGYRLRVDATLQVLLAKMDHSDAVAIDDLEVLDPEAIGGLCKIILKAGLRALLCMRVGSPQRVTNLPPQVGISYWLHNGEAVKLVDALAPAAVTA